MRLELQDTCQCPDNRTPSDQTNCLEENQEKTEQKELMREKSIVVLTPHNSLNDKGAEKKEVCFCTPVSWWEPRLGNLNGLRGVPFRLDSG